MHILISTAVIIEFDFDLEFQLHLKHQLGGVWLGENHWRVPCENEAKARDAALAMLGTDGTRVDTVNVAILFDKGGGIYTDEADLYVGPIQLLRRRRRYEKIGAYLHSNVSIATGNAEFHHALSYLMYRAPESEPGRILVGNVARQRALRLQERIRRGEMRDLDVIDLEILVDTQAQVAAETAEVCGSD